MDQLPDFNSFDAEFSRTGKLVFYTSYLHTGEVQELTFYFYDDVDELVLTVRCDADGRCQEVSHRRTSGDGEWVYWTTRTAAGTTIRSAVECYCEGRLLSIWSCDADGSTRQEKHFQYAGTKLFKSVSFNYAFRTIVERSATFYDSKGCVTKTFGLTGAGLPLGDGKYVYERDEEGRTKYIWSFNDWDPREFPNALAVYEYDCDNQGNWIERRKFHQFRSDRSWRLTKTTRRLEYFP